MNNKELRKNRVMMYFINATEELIREYGIEELTLREVAKKAGYNSATLYNYFENLDHLIFFAAMKYTKDYTLALKTYLLDSKNAMDRFLKVWECFCDFSYDNPEIYNAIFFPKSDKDVKYYVKQYYEIYPNELIEEVDTTSTMLIKTDINERGMTIVSDCVDEGFIRLEDADKLNDMTLLIFEGMLKRVLRNNTSYDDARNCTMAYIKDIVKLFLIKEYNFDY